MRHRSASWACVAEDRQWSKHWSCRLVIDGGNILHILCHRSVLDNDSCARTTHLLPVSCSVCNGKNAVADGAGAQVVKYDVRRDRQDTRIVRNTRTVQRAGGRGRRRCGRTCWCDHLGNVCARSGDNWKMQRWRMVVGPAGACSVLTCPALCIGHAQTVAVSTISLSSLSVPLPTAAPFFSIAAPCPRRRRASHCWWTHVEDELIKMPWERWSRRNVGRRYAAGGRRGRVCTGEVRFLLGRSGDEFWRDLCRPFCILCPAT